ncbi:jg3813 [Pararge aegeria aegeria]|uniref:Jg3813 protein n=2 Tax=Pararge aegeria TaxID=116150 RepID=A0A8S4RRM4_9NEOP|nr:jg3813 [Pararge aegeria aegeria]
MDTITCTNDLCLAETKTNQENILLDIIKEVCGEPTKLSQKLVGKVNRIIADCDLTHHASFHKLVTADDSTTTVLGFMHQTAAELTFDEQAELNEAIVNKIQDKIPIFTDELENLKQHTGGKESRNEKVRELQQNLDEKLNTLNEQENEKVELMMEWLNHRLHDVSSFSTQTNELLTIKTKILELKSKILHLRILCNIFTETNQSIKAYSEIHKDIKENLRETEQRIKNYKDIIASDL